ncbi:MAG: ABC transporter substrate-binding protein, partial [Oscillospiraceae bacterium]
MKKFLALILALVMSLSLVACGGGGGETGGEEEGGKITLDVIISQYGNYTQAWWTDFEATFEEANQDIDLNIEIVSWNDI